MEKINQLLTQKLPTEQLSVLKNLQNAYKSQNIASLKDAAINLAKITPEDDFLMMIETLSDYNFTGKFYGVKSVSSYILADLENMSISPSSPTTDLSGKIKCTCHWCGGLSNPGSNCYTTGSGCGFLWLYACDHCMACK